MTGTDTLRRFSKHAAPAAAAEATSSILFVPEFSKSHGAHAPDIVYSAQVHRKPEQNPRLTIL